MKASSRACGASIRQSSRPGSWLLIDSPQLHSPVLGSSRGGSIRGDRLGRGVPLHLHSVRGHHEAQAVAQSHPLEAIPDGRDASTILGHSQAVTQRRCPDAVLLRYQTQTVPLPRG